MSERVPLYEPNIGLDENNNVQEYMESGGWLTEHCVTRNFEKRFAEVCGSKHAVATSNGTTALITALHAVGVGRGSNVAVPALTHPATANAVVALGGRPVICDVEPETGCLADFPVNADAVVIVSLNGRYPRNVEALFELAAGHHVPVVEDACQALGSKYQGLQIGMYGDVGCFSFSPAKIVATGQGGACVTDNNDLAARMRKFKDFGRAIPGTEVYDEFGLNLKWTDLQAAVGLAQLQRLRWARDNKQVVANVYMNRGIGVGGRPHLAAGWVPWLMCYDAGDRQRVVRLQAWLAESGIQARPMYPALNRLPFYGHQEPCPNAEAISDECLWLPCFATMTDEQVHHVCDQIEAFDG